jgi:N-dimethylarginine dimethylaminohydrolase
MVEIKINKTVLMSGAEYFNDEHALNSHMDSSIPVDVDLAIKEHTAIKEALESAGVKVIQVPAPEDCQDGVYTANWGLCRGNKVVLSSLPNKRKVEEPYAEKILSDLGKNIIKVPDNLRFSGQGDALPCGNLLFAGSNYRTDVEVHKFLSKVLDYEVISLQTIPELDSSGQPVINKITGWPDSHFYDLDLALAIITPGLIAWCPDAFTHESQDKIRALDIDKIEVLLTEATQGFACNLVSTGETVLMSAHAPVFQASLESHGFQTITPGVTELGKGGGYIRCTTLTLDN